MQRVELLNTNVFSSTLYLAVGSVALEPLSTKTVKLGKSVTFNCVVFEGDNAVFSWTKDGLLLRENTRVEILKRRSTSTLIIESAEISDGGEYVCIASNGHSEDRSSAHLFVEGESYSSSHVSKPFVLAT